MIRRNGQSPAGEPVWIVIPQREHACLAGELAAAWLPGFAGWKADAELIQAVFHHDDGWRDWDRHPEIDPGLGRPRQFTEMPFDVGADIWRTCISTCLEIGPLAGWVVAQHFLALAEHRNPWQLATTSHAAPAAPAVIASLGLDAIPVPTDRSAQQAQQALGWLQFFDALSLWFCCAERTERQAFALPDRQQLILVPSGTQFNMHPWPLTKPKLTLTVSATVYPQKSYVSDQEFAAASTTAVELSWEVISGGTTGNE